MIKWKYFSFVSAGLLMLSAGCGEPSVEEMDEALTNTGQAISKKSWQKAAEQMRTFEDYWNLTRSDYQKQEVKKIDKLIHDIEMSLAISDKKQSQKRWNHLVKRWEGIN